MAVATKQSIPQQFSFGYCYSLEIKHAKIPFSFNRRYPSPKDQNITQSGKGIFKVLKMKTQMIIPFHSSSVLVSVTVLEHWDQQLGKIVTAQAIEAQHFFDFKS